jgi:ankyrin repeat protein
MLDAGGRLDISARGDGGTPLIWALFWGHRDVVPLLGLEPENLRVAAGLGLAEMIGELVGTPQAGAHRAFYRPHGGFPAWTPSDDPQEILDEALVWAAKSDRVEVLDLLVELGARVEADPYRGTTLAWAAVNGRVASIRELVALGVDPNQRAPSEARSRGGRDSPSPPRRVGGGVETLLEVGADPTIRDSIYTAPRRAGTRPRSSGRA